MINNRRYNVSRTILLRVTGDPSLTTLITRDQKFCYLRPFYYLLKPNKSITLLLTNTVVVFEALHIALKKSMY